LCCLPHIYLVQTLDYYVEKLKLFFDRETETIEMGLVNLLKQYYMLMSEMTTEIDHYKTKEIEMENYLEKLKKRLLTA
jgi:hypothetical protein